MNIPKIPIFSTFFLEFLFYINLYYFRFNIVLYNKEFPEKMLEFRNSISILHPKWELNSENTNFYYVFSRISILYKFILFSF